MDATIGLFERDVRLTVGMPGQRHPVTVRLTPWSVTPVSNPCDEFPPALRALSICDCRSRLGNLVLRTEDLLHRWALGASVETMQDAMLTLSIPVEFREVIEQFRSQIEWQTLSLFVGLREEGLAKRVKAGRGDAADECPADECPADECAADECAADGSLECRAAESGLVGLDLERVAATDERLLGCLLDAQDPEPVWLGLHCLRSSSHERRERLLGPRLKTFDRLPLGLRLQAIHLAKPLPLEDRQQECGELVASALSDPGLTMPARIWLLREIPRAPAELACQMLLKAMRLPGRVLFEVYEGVLQRILQGFTTEYHSSGSRQVVVGLLLDLLEQEPTLEEMIGSFADSLVLDLERYLRRTQPTKACWKKVLQLLGHGTSVRAGRAILLALSSKVIDLETIKFGFQRLRCDEYDLTKGTEESVQFLLELGAELKNVWFHLADPGYGSVVRVDPLDEIHRQWKQLDCWFRNWTAEFNHELDANFLMGLFLKRLASGPHDLMELVIQDWGKKLLAMSADELRPEVVEAACVASGSWAAIFSGENA